MEGKGADLGDTVVYPISNSRENQQVVMVWKGELKRFKQKMKLEHPRAVEDPEREGVKGYLGIWVEGHPLKEGGWVDAPEEETSVTAKSGLEGEECMNQDSLGTSSGYAEEMVAKFSQEGMASPQHEVESPIS